MIMKYQKDGYDNGKGVLQHFDDEKRIFIEGQIFVWELKRVTKLMFGSSFFDCLLGSYVCILLQQNHGQEGTFFLICNLIDHI